MAYYHKVPKMSTVVVQCFVLICLGLLMLSAGAIIGLKYTTHQFVAANSNSTGPYGNTYDANRIPQSIGILPLHLIYDYPAAWTRSAGAFTLTFSGVALILFIVSRYKSFNFNYVLSVLLTFQTIFILIALAVVFAIHANSTHFDPSYRTASGAFGPRDQYEKGTFDFETWTCDLVGKPVDPIDTSFQTQCRLEKAGRWLLVPMSIISIVALLPPYFKLDTSGKRDGDDKPEEGDELRVLGESA